LVDWLEPSADAVTVTVVGFHTTEVTIPNSALESPGPMVIFGGTDALLSEDVRKTTTPLGPAGATSET